MCKEKLREKFLENKHVTDIRTIDLLVVKVRLQLFICTICTTVNLFFEKKLVYKMKDLVFIAVSKKSVPIVYLSIGDQQI